MRRKQRSSGSPITLFSFQDLITSLSGILILLVLLMAVEVATRKLVESRSVGADSSARKAAIREINAEVTALRTRVSALRENMQTYATADPIVLIRRATDEERRTKELQARAVQLQEAKSRNEELLAAVQSRANAFGERTGAFQQQIDDLRAATAKVVEEKKLFFIPESGSLKTAVLVECAGSGIRVGHLDRADEPRGFAVTSEGFRNFEKWLGELSNAREYLVFMIKPSAVSYWARLVAIASSGGFDVGYDALEEDCSIGFGGVRR